MRLEEYCDNCDSTVRATVRPADFMARRTGRIRCPECGHVVKPCNECGDHSACDSCPWENASIADALGKRRKHKSIGLSKKMLDALADEGLILTKSVEQNGIIYEGSFFTGVDYEKTVNIDLRGKRPKTKRQADKIACIELRVAYDQYSVAEQMRKCLNAQNDGLQGVPEPERLLADLQEEEAQLERFADVANAVYWKQPIPPAPEEVTWEDSRSASFYAIQSAKATNLYWRTLDGYHNGAIDECWGDVETADRFDTKEDAERIVRDVCRERSIEPGKVVRVETETTIRIYETNPERRHDK